MSLGLTPLIFRTDYPWFFLRRYASCSSLRTAAIQCNRSKASYHCLHKTSFFIFFILALIFKWGNWIFFTTSNTSFFPERFRFCLKKVCVVCYCRSSYSTIIDFHRNGAGPSIPLIGIVLQCLTDYSRGLVAVAHESSRRWSGCRLHRALLRAFSHHL